MDGVEALVPCVPVLARAERSLEAVGRLRGGTVFEPKWDGFRALVAHGVHGVRIFSRQGNDLTRCFPDIVDAATAQLPVGTVVDGELVVWGGSGLDFAALQRRLLLSGDRCRVEAAQAPATLLVFDVLAVPGSGDVRGWPLVERRRRLVELAGGWVPPVQLTPQTADVAVAVGWLTGHAAAGVGIEGVVAKGAGDRYVPGRRLWVKVRYRHTAEAVVGAVVGSVVRPRRLVLGLPDGAGGLRVAGATQVLTDRQAATIGALLVAVDPAAHPWPRVLPAGWLGRYAAERVAVELVDPLLVVEVDADTAFEHGRWRHLVRLVRDRRDLTVADVTAPDVDRAR